MAYAFNCNTSDAFDNSIFLNYKIINRSSNSYTDVYTGIFTDLDLGNPTDDLIECDVQRGCYFAYNGDDNDEAGSGVSGYGENPPAQAVVILAGPYVNPDGIDNPTSFDTVDNVPVLNCTRGDILNGNINGLNFEDGVVDNERLGMTRFLYFKGSGTGANPATLFPYTASGYYSYLKGLWLDGSSLCYGGTGHVSGGGDPETPTSFMFPGSPTSDACGWGQGGIPMPDWSEGTEMNVPGDRRGLGYSGPFTFSAGDTVELDIAYVYGRSTDLEISSVQVMKENVDIIRNGYLNNITPCGTPFYYSGINPNPNFTDFSANIFPNPANNNITVELTSNKNSKVSVKIMDINGRVYLSENLSVNSGLNKSVIDINSLSAGIYFVAIDNDENVTNKKLVVLR